LIYYTQQGHTAPLQNIEPYHINDINKDSVAVTCNGIGYLPWHAPDGTTLLVKCYHSSSAIDTIFSPLDVVLNHLSDYSAWTQHSDLVTGKGYINFVKPAGDRV
jgi:hypothetical protein